MWTVGLVCVFVCVCACLQVEIGEMKKMATFTLQSKDSCYSVGSVSLELFIHTHKTHMCLPL